MELKYFETYDKNNKMRYRCGSRIGFHCVCCGKEINLGQVASIKTAGSEMICWDCKNKEK